MKGRRIFVVGGIFMKCIIFANGEYGVIDEYKEIIQEADIIICADGGANYAYEINILPECIIGDMDSINEDVKDYFTNKKVEFKKYPRRKDFTDTQLALEEAEERGATEITLLGTLGKRLDHTLANIYSCMDLAMKGISIKHYSPKMTAYLVNRKLELEGEIGDIVSVLAISEVAEGVFEEGFEYSLPKGILEKNNPYAISNILREKMGTISLEKGLLLVTHYS